MTKSCRPAELDEGQAKHQSRPVDERAAAAAAGRFIDVPPDLSTPPTGPSPYQGAGTSVARLLNPGILRRRRH
jgi:hypothetical protein